MRRLSVMLVLLVSVLGLLAFGAASPAGALISTGNGGWLWQTPLPHGADYLGAWFADPRHATLVTDGCILSTADGGATAKVRLRTSAYLRDVSFVGRRGWVVGYPLGEAGRAVLYSTTDGGATWARIPLGLRGGLLRVDFVSAKAGWAAGWRVAPDGRIGYCIFRTSDGGRTWKTKIVDGVYDWVDLCMVDAKSGFAVGQGETGARLWATTDGGDNWQPLGSSPSSVATLFFLTPQTGWVATWTGQVLRTDNAGETWTEQTVSLGASEYPSDIAFSDALSGWLTGSEGSVWTTVDGGTTWVPVESAAKFGLTRVQPLGPDAAAVVGQRGTVGVTVDGGQTWRRQPTEVLGSADLDDVDFTDLRHGFVVDGGILATADGGATWERQDAAGVSGLHALQFVDRRHGWAVGTGGAVVSTDDGGAKWEPQDSGTSLDLSDVFFLDDSRGWLVGSDLVDGSHDRQTVVCGTSDGGAHWSTLAGGGSSVWAISFATARRGWLVGSTWNEFGTGTNALVLGTRDGGRTWKVQANLEPTELDLRAAGEDLRRGAYRNAVVNAVYAIDATHVVAVGDVEGSPLVVRTVDGGVHWRSKVLRRGGALCDVTFVDEVRGWAAGRDVIFRTTDGGAHWTPQRTGVDYASHSLSAVSFVDARHGWACGDDGILLRTTSGGVRR